MCAAEIDFPRGGVQKLLRTTQQLGIGLHSAVQKRQKQGQNQRASSGGVGSKSQSKKPKLEEKEDEYAGVFRQVVSSDLLAQDVRGLAFVKFIGEIDLTLECVEGIQLSLPANLISKIFRDHLATTNATLEDIFRTGQAVAFKVLKIASRRDVKKENPKTNKPVVTVCPYEVNSHLVPSLLVSGMALNGAILSIEEKGALVDLGLQSSAVRGFVQAEELPAYLPLSRLHIGQVALFRVKEQPTTTTRIVKLTGFVEMDALDQTKPLEGKSLMPGTIVQVEPEKMVTDGVFVSVKNGPKVFLRKVHLPPRLRFDQGPVTRAMRACVLCSQPNSSLLVLSAHPDVVALSKIDKRLLPTEFKIGSRINGRVFHVDKQQNVYLRLDEDNEKQTMTAKCLRINIDDIEANLPKFGVGSEHQCRVMAYSATERQLIVSTRADHLRQRIVSTEDGRPGAKIVGTVKAIKPGGLLVEIGNGLMGTVGAMHTLDRPEDGWHKQFRKGQQLHCRILFINQNSNRLMLTAKPCLVKKPGNERMIVNLDTNLEGATATGVVIKRLDGGSLLVSFYNRTVGLLPQSKVGLLPTGKCQIGMPLRVRVQRVDTDQGQMLLDIAEESHREEMNDTKQQVIGIGGAKKEKVESKSEGTKVIRAAKPFGIYAARVLGPWPYGGTCPETTAELHISGGTIGRLHVSELDGLEKLEEGVCPMQHFLHRNEGKMVNIKVISVSRPREFTKKGLNLLTEVHGTDRIVECTAKTDKIQENRRKLKLINYRSEFGEGQVVPFFFVSHQDSHSGEINPDFRAQIDMKEGEGGLFDKGELRYGRVVGVNKTKRGKIVVLEMSGKEEKKEGVECEQPVKEEEEDEEKEEDETDSEEEGEEEEEDEKAGGLMAAFDGELQGEERASAEEYERAVAASPNSVPLWIGFVQYYLYKTGFSAKIRYELGKAVAERSLRSISFQNDSDLANIWMTYLNLEVLLGNEDSLQEVFRRACAASNSLQMHKYLVKLLKKQTNADGRHQEIQSLYESMLKKFRHADLSIWFGYAKHLLQRGDAAESRQLLERALQCLEKRKHITILNHFAQLEHSFGDKERAKTIRELVKGYREGGKGAGARLLVQAISSSTTAT